MKGTSGISTEDSAAGSAGKDQIAFNHWNQRDTGEDLIGKKEGQASGARSGHDSCTKFSGSRFIRLEGMEDLDEANMEVEDNTEDISDKDVNAVNGNSRVAAGNNGARKGLSVNESSLDAII